MKNARNSTTADMSLLLTQAAEKRLVLKHIKDALPPTLDPHQYAYRTNRSMGDLITIALHTVLHQLCH
ncbi:hypothetical protein P4O66_010074, partial [Electrophorus voltai]